MSAQPVIPKTLYKFLPREYVRAFKKSGSLRIGTLHDFRRTEHGSEIGDTEEGEITLTTGDETAVYDSKHLAPEQEWQRPHMEERFGGQGIKLVASGGIHHRVSASNSYLFCTGLEYDWKTIDEPSYNACFRIDDPESFCQVLCAEIPDIESGYYYGKVEYHQKTTLGHNYPGFHPALVKDPSYSHQKEFRFMFKPINASMTLEPLIINARRARKYCTFVKL